MCVLGLPYIVYELDVTVLIFAFLAPHLPALQSTDNRGGSLERAGVSGLELTSIKSTHSKGPAPPPRWVTVWFPSQLGNETGMYDSVIPA